MRAEWVVGAVSDVALDSVMLRLVCVDRVDGGDISGLA